MDTVKILHVVGYKNSGKTTLMKNWISYLKESGYKVAAIKHHGHGAKLAMPDEAKDSMQYIAHGADMSLVSGGGYTQQIMQKESSYKELIALARRDEPDIILVEGFKEEQGKKVVLATEEEWETLQQLDGIVLVVGDVETDRYETIASRTFEDRLNSWLRSWLREGF